MPTVPEKIETALFASLVGMTITGSPPLALPNTPFPDPDEDKPDTFIEVRHFPNNNSRLLIRGSDPHRRLGILQFTIFAPLNGGYETATQIAGEVAAYYPADRFIDEDDVRVRIQQAPDIIGADVTEDKVSWSSRVDVRYECFK